MTYLPPPEKQALFQSQLFLYFSDLRTQRQRSIALVGEPAERRPSYHQLLSCVAACSRGYVRVGLELFEVGPNVKHLEAAVS
jgi:hypothetical protein